MFFETKRLLIRKINSEDFDCFNDMQGNPNVAKYTTGIPKNEEENRREFKKIIDNYNNTESKSVVMAVAKKDSNQFIGTCATINNEVGYRLMEKHWGKGYGKEILEGLIEFCFVNMGLDYIDAYVIKENIASVKILDDSKLQFVEEKFNDETGYFERYYHLKKSEFYRF